MADQKPRVCWKSEIFSCFVPFYKVSIKRTVCRKDILLGPVAFLEVRQFLVHIFSVVWQPSCQLRASHGRCFQRAGSGHSSVSSYCSLHILVAFSSGFEFVRLTPLDPEIVFELFTVEKWTAEKTPPYWLVGIIVFPEVHVDTAQRFCGSYWIKTLLGDSSYLLLTVFFLWCLYNILNTTRTGIVNSFTPEFKKYILPTFLKRNIWVR